MSNLFEVINLKKKLGEVQAVDGVSLSLKQGEFLVILGRSGSGKSTLLSLMSGLEAPDEGQIFFKEENIVEKNEEQLAIWRRNNIGLVFQSYNIIPTLSAVENVAFPLYPEKMSEKERTQKALQVLEQVGLANRANHRPNQLSGGEQQRVAIARALVNQPSLIFADEPTGNLDSKTGDHIIELFQRLRKETNVTFVLVTHDEMNVAKKADRIVRIVDGRIKDEIENILA